MLELLISWGLGFFAEFLRGVVEDWRRDRALQEAERLRIERDSALRDLKAGEDAAASADTLAADIERRSATARKKAEDYANTLPKDGGSVLTDADIERLRDIRKR